MIRITLPAPTSVNAMYGHGWRKSKAYLDWIDAAGKTILVERPKWPVLKILDGWYGTQFFHPIGAKYDIDNAQKAVHDLLVSMRITPDDKLLFATASERVFDMTGNTFDLSVFRVTDPTRPQFVPLLGTIGAAHGGSRMVIEGVNDG